MGFFMRKIQGLRGKVGKSVTGFYRQNGGVKKLPSLFTGNFLNFFFLVSVT